MAKRSRSRNTQNTGRTATIGRNIRSTQSLGVTAPTFREKYGIIKGSTTPYRPFDVTHGRTTIPAPSIAVSPRNGGKVPPKPKRPRESSRLIGVLRRDEVRPGRPAPTTQTSPIPRPQISANNSNIMHDSSPDKVRIVCKARPKGEQKKGIGKGASRDFIPWCK